MAEYEITNKKQALKRLGLKNWSYLTQDHFMELYVLLEKMDPETRAFVQKQMAKVACDALRKEQDATILAIEQNSEVEKKALEVSKETIKALDHIALSGLPEEQQDKMADLVIKVHEDALKQADESRKSNNKALAILSATTVVAAAVAVACVGGKVDLSKIGRLVKNLRS